MLRLSVVAHPTMVALEYTSPSSFFHSRNLPLQSCIPLVKNRQGFAIWHVVCFLLCERVRMREVSLLPSDPLQAFLNFSRHHPFCFSKLNPTNNIISSPHVLQLEFGSQDTCPLLKTLPCGISTLAF
jgi:hypothetical protein